MLRSAALLVVASSSLARAFVPLPGSFENFQPSTTIVTNQLQLPELDFFDSVELAAAEVADLFKVIVEQETSAQFVVDSAYRTSHNGVNHIVLRQQINGFPVFNGDVQLNVLKTGAVSSVHERIFQGVLPAVMPAPSDVSLTKALASFAAFLGGSTTDLAVVRPVKFKFGYIQDGEELVTVWELDVKRSLDHYNVFVDATTFEVKGLNNYVHYARPMTRSEVGRYNGLQRPKISPDSGDLSFVELPTNDPSEGGLGYHAFTGTNFTDTRGNNCYAQENRAGTIFPTPDGKDRPDGEWDGNMLVFSDTADFSQAPDTYTSASTLNCFNWINEVHDIWYAHGFDEVSGNFQMDNFGRGGLGDDPVWAFSQDGIMNNNAVFSTPPDGDNGVMRMFEWTMTNPRRDSGFENTIVIHEYCHGLSNRLTGGPANSNCLSGGQSGGMGEGWGDLFGLLLTLDEASTRATTYGIGMWVIGEGLDGLGIRARRYCLADSCNNGRFSDNRLPAYGAVHAKGELWSNFNYEVYWNLRDKRGYSADVYGTEGDKKFFTLLLDGMKNQPCNPSFIQARDGILESEQVSFGNEDRCEIWCGYARRGLGVSATSSGANDATNGYDVPAECENTCRSIYGADWPFSDP